MSTLPKGSIKKIAVLRANALGDFIFVLPALTALKETFPEAELVYLGRKWHYDFLQDRPSPINRVVIVPPILGLTTFDQQEQSDKDLKEFFEKMQSEKFDIAFQLHGGGKYSNPFIKKLGAKLTIGLQTPDAISLDVSIPYVYYQSEAQRYLEVVSAIDATTANTSSGHISPSEKDLYEANKLLEVQQQKTNDKWLASSYDRKLVLLHPGATDPKRRWPPESFAIIGDELAKKGYRVLISGTGEKENTIIEAIRSTMHESAENVCNKLSLGGMVGLLAQCDLVISNDTGILHLAIAVGAPTVGIYWCGNVINGAPMFRTYHRPVISWLVTCPLCGQNIADNYPFVPSPRCNHMISFVTEITPETVLSEVESLSEVS